ncbi:MAG: sigma-54 dependent transcriptional regulator [Desulfuromonadaceae bacterium]|nr:sigma-54 dependent transcriptional regulator [Desulfuromonadaceae bacterium]MDD2847772.1 sigma-54 dependent transcriptional regulator [Desulfuromonadaceae bacterium]MDD4129683.1 sigma-54 dependent transcriptional regulator [Desulfuromonadaceae bacterium]
MPTPVSVEDRAVTKPPLLLLVDDDATSLLVLGGYLKRFGFAVVTASGGEQALELLGEREFDLLISDLRMPGMDGITLLQEMHTRNVTIPFIVVTACGSIESAVDAMRQGAYDYLEKPFNPDSLQLTVQRALDYHRAMTENRQIRAYLQECFTFQNIITVNPAMKETLEMAAKVTSFPQTTVAIYGESGTGKEVLARAIHFATTGMPTRFVAINCAAIPEHLMESELFGHVKGAFTGAERDREGKFSQAGNGTLLLDEVGDMPLPLQAKLLRALQERTFEKIGSNQLIPITCRVIVATNANLSQRVEAGSFREDLYHRVNVFPLSIPPLRERKDDIWQICEYVLAELQQHLGKPLPGISQRAMDVILGHDWPGNVRELRNRLERAAILTSGDLIRPEHLGLCQGDAQQQGGAQDVYSPCTTYNLQLPTQSLSLASLTSRILTITLERCKGNKSKAAQLLKIDRKMFYRD